MKKPVLILVAVMMSLVMVAQVPVPFGFFGAATTAAGGGGGGGADAYEDFEGSNNPDAGYTLSNWGKIGTVTPHSVTSPAPLAGSFSGLIDSSGASHEDRIDRAVSSYDEIWLTYAINLRWSSGSPTTTFPCYFLNGGTNGTVQSYVYIKALANNGGVMGAVDQIGLNESNTTDSLTTNSTWYVKAHVKKGSGANGIIDVEFSSSKTFAGSGNKFIQRTDYASTLAIDAIRVGGTSGSGRSFWAVFDDIRYWTNAPSNPLP